LLSQSNNPSIEREHRYLETKMPLQPIPANLKISWPAAKLSLLNQEVEERGGEKPRHARACRGHPRLSCGLSESKTWMAGTSPATTAMNGSI